MIWSRARSLASMGPAVLRQQKRMMRSWQEQPLRTAIEESIGEFAKAYASGEPQHYMNQFINRKRNK
jgi:enoyl-CoA hydratase/carnithine racemase